MSKTTDTLLEVCVKEAVLEAVALLKSRALWIERWDSGGEWRMTSVFVRDLADKLLILAGMEPEEKT